MYSRGCVENLPPQQAGSELEAAPLLTWQVHLLRRYPQRLSILILTLLLAAGCVWMLFRQPLPALVAVLLLLGSVREYLFPFTYSLTVEGVAARGPGLQATLPWKEARRCLRERNAVTVTPLSVPSRLDAFRGVTLRFALKGQPGDRESVLAVIARCAPELISESKKEEKSEPL